MATIGGSNIVRSGLILELDAANRRSYVSGSTVWNDVSGNNITGSLVNTPTFSTTNNGLFTFNGTNQYVSLGTFTGLGTTNRTYSFWYTTSALPASTGRIINFPADDTSTDTPAFTLAIDNFSNLTGGLGGTPYDGQVTIVAYTLNTWVNVCSTITSKTVSFYINGVFIKSATSTGTVPSNPIGYIGRYNTFYSQYTTGSVSFFQLYNRVLSASEITQNYNATKARFGL